MFEQQILALQEERAKVQHFTETRSAEVYKAHHVFYRKRLDDLDAEIDEYIKANAIINWYRNRPNELLTLQLWFLAQATPPEPIDLSQGSTQEWWDGVKMINPETLEVEN